MRQVHRKLEKDGSGVLKLIAEDPEDMWHAYNLISVGDGLTTTALRKVVHETKTGSTDSKKVRTNLTIQVISINFDTEACSIRIAGKNIKENPFVKMGAHHTLEMELQRAFTIEKDCWDRIMLDRIDLACDPTKSADLAAVIMQPGLAHVCLVTTNMTLLRSKIETTIPRKRPGSSQHDKANTKFFDRITEAMMNHVDFAVVKCVLIASPAFLKDQYYEYLLAQAVRSDNRAIIENKSKFVLVHSTSGQKDALNEVLQDPSIAGRVADTKAAGEMRKLEEFYAKLNDNPDTAFYGVRHVNFANEQGAIQTLLVTDSLFRSADVATRKQYVNLVETAEENGAEIRIFSSLHVSGERLSQLSGVAAILRFPLPDDMLGDIEESSSDSDSDADGGDN